MTERKAHRPARRRRGPFRNELADGALRVAGALATPLVPSDYVEVFLPLLGADLRGRVLTVEPLTSDSVTITIRPGRSWRGHLPGQYVRIGIDIDGVRHWRPYSLTSQVSGPQGTISINPKLLSGGLVSEHLVRRLKPGTVIALDQATGDFTLPPERPPRLLFITGGSGITPVIGMLRNHLRELRDVVLLHSAPTAADVMFAGELMRWSESGALRLIQLHTDSDGMLDLQRLGEHVPDWQQRTTWACGPTGLLDACEQHWEQTGLADAIHTERFRPTIAVAGEGGTVTFTETGVTVDVDGSTPLLDAGEEAGVLMPSGCRMGICYGCVSTLRSGAVRDLRDGMITTAEHDDTISIQTCVCTAAGPCEVER